MLRTSILFLAALLYTSPALAAWGENWGEMVWGASAPSAVPSIEGLGLGLLVLVLIGLAIRGLRSRATLGLMVLASFVGAADLAEAQVTIPNTFTDGTPALASEVNANFEALASAVNASECATPADVVCDPLVTVSCPACDTLGAYDQGRSDGVGSVDVAAATAAAFADGVASVDITTDNAAAERAAGQVACLEAGGSWTVEIGVKSNCVPPAPPPPPPYNCSLGSFCLELAIWDNPSGPTVYNFPAYRDCETVACLESNQLAHCGAGDLSTRFGHRLYHSAGWWDSSRTVSQNLSEASLVCQRGGASAS